MRKAITIFAVIIIGLAFSACSAQKEKRGTVFDEIQNSSVALMESSDGDKVYVWNMLDLGSLASLRIEETSLEPADKEDDWMYRITYNPKDKVKNGEEIIVSFHREYIQIGTKLYST